MPLIARPRGRKLFRALVNIFLYVWYFQHYFHLLQHAVVLMGFSKPSATPLHTHTHTHIKTQLSVFTILMGLSNMQIKHCLMYFLRKENCYILFRYMSEASMHDLKKTRLFWLNRQKVDLSYIICVFREFIRCFRMLFF